MAEYYDRSRRPPYFSGAAAAIDPRQGEGHGRGPEWNVGSITTGAAATIGGVDRPGNVAEVSSVVGVGGGGEADVAAGSRVRRRNSLNNMLSVLAGGGVGGGQGDPQPQPSQQQSESAQQVQQQHLQIQSLLPPTNPSPIRNPLLTGVSPGGRPGGIRNASASLTAGVEGGSAGGAEPPHPLDPDAPLLPTWRLKERMKTVGVCLVLALNIGTDPPDVNKPTPCARLQTWLDPASVSRAKARERIGERLEAQYARWQQRAKQLKYRRALDPTVEDVRGLCLAMRRQARAERVLFHYNGHGVPRPTANGEIWLFDKNHTQYNPLSVTDLRAWLGRPSIVVLDCSGAGVLMPYLTAPLGVDPLTTAQQQAAQSAQPELILDETEMAARSVRDTIVLCPTAENELLPMNPEYPADIFTSCLTTPIPMALRWFIHQNPLSMGGIADPDATADAVPGKLNDRKTPLGELNWIFTAVTDTIAWNVLPSPLFQRLFRQDLLVASMFRNFLLADRILRSLNCTPASHPPLPPGVADHPLWKAWDLACETCLCGLMGDGLLGVGTGVSALDIGADEPPPVMAPGGHPGMHSAHLQGQQVGHVAGHTTEGGATALPSMTTTTTAPFFAEQLTAFEIWLEFASATRGTTSGQDASAYPPGVGPPEQLPVVLQVLLSQAHRVRALALLRRFLGLGPWAVNLALSVGIFPYVLKLLQSPIDEYKHVLVGIWAKILSFDPSCQVDLVKDGALPHFVNHLNWGLGKKGNGGQLAPAGSGAGGPSRSRAVPWSSGKDDAAEQRTMAAFILSAISLGYAQGQAECLRLNLHGSCAALLSLVELNGGDNGQEDRASIDTAVINPELLAEQCTVTDERVPPPFRLWLCICLGNLVKDNETAQTEAYRLGIHVQLFARLNDDSPDVRAAACYALGCLLGSSSQQLQQQGEDEEHNGGGGPPPGPVAPTPGQVAPPVPGALHPNGAPGTVAHNMGLVAPLQATGVAAPGWPQQHRQPQPQQMMRSQQPVTAHFHQQQPPPPGPLYDVAPPTQMVGLIHPPAAAGRGHILPPGVGAYGHMGPEGQPLPTPVHASAPYGHSQPPQQQQQLPPPQPPQPHPPTSVLNDRRRLGLDALTIHHLARATKDASPTVRHEAVLSLACAVGKYLQTFTTVADEATATSSASATSSPARADQEGGMNHEEDSSSSPSASSAADAAASGDGASARSVEGPPSECPSDPSGEDTAADGHGGGATAADKRAFESAWSDLRYLQHSDPYPPVSTAANAVVSVVHEHILVLRMALAQQEQEQNEWQAAAIEAAAPVVVGQGRRRKSAILPSTAGGSLLGDDIAESEPVSLPHPQHAGLGRHSLHSGPVEPFQASVGYPAVPGGRTVLQHSAVAGGQNAAGAPPGGLAPAPLRRNLSDNVTPGMWGNSHGAHGRRDARSGPEPLVFVNHIGVSGNGANRPSIAGSEAQFRIEYTLPKSKFYQWKCLGFGQQDGPPSSSAAADDCGPLFAVLDPLSMEGAVQAYRYRRNLEVLERSDDLADRFASLAPKPPQSVDNIRSFGTDIFGDDSDDAALQDEMAAKKRDLHMEQSALLVNDGMDMTSMLLFHPYEPALVATDGCDYVSLWDIATSQRVCMFKNGNPKGSRMTSVSWINDSSTSLLLTGSDDGIVRVWDGLIESNGEMICDQPDLSSAFFAAPDLVAGERGSGLVTEWQQFSGRLIAGGNSKWIRCWDLEAEKCRNMLDCKSHACVTTLTSAWGCGPHSAGSNDAGRSGIGPDIIIAGYGDGGLKVFDIRSNQAGPVLGNTREKRTPQRPLRKMMQYAEHSSWIVDTSFTGFGGRYEVVSGCVAGDIKFWDVRVSSSLRTLDVQRSPMTALAGHPTIPMLATGSHAQFIKILTLDGDTLQVIRYHEKIAGQRIGPVSCLGFHPHKPLLAAGATDEIISLYSPTKDIA